ncbi:MAG: hypothetical protein LBQ84_06365, partial [Flavobacteriaceae bacterium]|nr:hypothetical protein [Flavobacteriaceae bacterium]
MKKKKLNLLQWFVPLCALLVFALISCKDDDLTESSDPPGTDEPIGYATGGVITTEADWEGIPVLTDVSQLNLGEPQGSQKNLYASKLIDNELPPLFNQGKYGTCTSSSVAYGVAMLTRKLSGMKYANSALHAPNDSARTFSVAFLHGTSHRKKETPTPVDKIPTTGLHIPEVLRTLREDGVPTYPDYRYTKHNIINVPDQKIKDKAHFNSSNIFRIINEGQQTLTQIREIIDRDGVVFFSMLIPINPDVPHLRNGKQIIGYQELINDESPARVNAIINGAVTQEDISKKAYSGHTMTI